MQQPDAAEGNRVTFQYYVVAIIDFLGQKDYLKGLDHLPATPEQVQGFIAAAKKTWGTISPFRNLLRQSFLEFTTHRPPAQLLAPLTEKQKDEWEKRSACSIELMHFSDTVIIFAPLALQSEEVTAKPVYGLLATCGAILLGALSCRVPFRGGIEVGIAAPLPEADIYGPALAQAHYLENKVAKYPRIVVGNNLLEFLDALSDDSTSAGLARVNRGIANECLGLIGRDDDGRAIVDYAGASFASLADFGASHGNKGYDERRRRALTFATEEADRFACDDNAKLAGRYERLKRYIESRSGPWLAV